VSLLGKKGKGRDRIKKKQASEKNPIEGEVAIVGAHRSDIEGES